MLSRLVLEKFRNFNEKELSLGLKTFVVGKNGTGKSNILEAIRLLSVGKSFKTSRLDEAIKFEDRYFRIGGEIHDKKYLEFFYGVQFVEEPIKERRLILDNQEISWLDFLGDLPSVLFTPLDTEIITGSPQIRRKYLDGILWQVDKGFRYDYLEMTKVLKERSVLLWLLKTGRSNRGELEPWNEILLKLTDKIRSKRLIFVDYLKEFLEKTGSQPKIEVNYLPNKVEMNQVLEQEIKSSQNIYGSHRDEVEISYNERQARRFASRGQARQAIVLIKAAEAAYLHEKTGNKPIILLDDLYSELDKTKADKLISMFSDNYQVISTAIEKPAIIDGWEIIEL